MYLLVCICDCVYLCVCERLCVSVTVTLCACLYLCLCMCMYVCVHLEEKETSDTWEPEIQEAMSHLTWVLGTKRMEEQRVSLTTEHLLNP